MKRSRSPLGSCLSSLRAASTSLKKALNLPLPPTQRQRLVELQKRLESDRQTAARECRELLSGGAIDGH